MIFRAIGFDLSMDLPEEEVYLFQLNNNLPFEKAHARYYETIWKHNMFELCNDAAFVCHKVVRDSSVIRTRDIKKLLVCCSATSNPLRKEVVKCDGFLEVQIPFNYKRYFNSNEEEKITFFLDSIIKAVEIASSYGISDLEPLIFICNKLKQGPFENIWTWKKKRLPNGYTASIVLEHGMKYMKIYACFENKKEQKFHKALLAETGPGYLDYEHRLGKLEVYGENGIKLYNKYSDRFIVAKVPKSVSM